MSVRKILFLSSRATKEEPLPAELRRERDFSGAHSQNIFKRLNVVLLTTIADAPNLLPDLYCIVMSAGLFYLTSNFRTTLPSATRFVGDLPATAGSCS